MIAQDLRRKAGARSRVASWSIGCWIVLLLAAFGGIQYARNGDYAYLLAAFAVIVVCAGCVLRHGWARNVFRAMAVLLAFWALGTAVLMGRQWDEFELARQHALAQAQAPLLMLLIEQARRSWLMSMTFKALLVPLLLWLAWQLGRPAVREQFSLRRGRARQSLTPISRAGR